MHTHRISFLFACLICHTLHGEDGFPYRTASAPVCAVLIGGIDSDPTPEQIQGTAQRGRGQSGMYQLAGDLSQRGITAEYFNWNGTRAGKIHQKAPLAEGIADYIADRHAGNPTERLAIVANSWGGHTAWQVCQSLADQNIQIELAVFLDPSSLGRTAAKRPTTLPASVKQARNYYTRNMFGWRDLPIDDRLINIDLGDETHGFQLPDGPKYHAAFDVNAHIAAEWDPRIHNEISKHVIELLNQPTISIAGGESAVPK